MKNPPGDFLTPFEKGNGNQTSTYDECISWYEKLDSLFDEARLLTYGTTSVGKPLHLFVISSDRNFDPKKIHAEGKCILLINNGIHPGEPDGIDASMMFARDLLTKGTIKWKPDHVVVCIIPVYNVSGMLNRGSSSRANQNCPEEYGFRGTAQNYDLNRDFTKCDSKEAQTFTEIFQTWKPEIFIDTHVSNGADYQYTMTLIPTQKDKLQSILSAYQETTLLPELYATMKENKFETIPYVNPVGETPDSGIAAFLETPRFSTGYAALFNCIGMMPETHMLKPYNQRVWSTYHLIAGVCNIVNRDANVIRRNKEQADEAVKQQTSFPLEWKFDDSHFDWIPFKGFAAKYKKSEVTDSMRLWYDRNEPYEKKIKFFNNYIPATTIDKPFAYLIPQAWEEVIDRLKWNGVEIKQLSNDTAIQADVYYIEAFSTWSIAGKNSQNPYEGHYIHYNVSIRKEAQQLKFYKGDYAIFPNQPCNRYITEMLEPQGVDSYFAWNFFDPVLMEKEFFSDYVFEDVAAELLKKDPTLKKAFDEKKSADAAFAKDPQAQLNFIYQGSPNFERSVRKYPVARIEKQIKLPLK